MPYQERRRSITPRVVVVGLASCFGCQLQITNQEQYLTDVLGQIEVVYWQMTSSEPMPDSFDVAVIEGAVTNRESEEMVRELREKASKIITIGACATTAGIPGIAAKDYDGRAHEVYDVVPEACGEMISPRSVDSVIDVDYEVRCCPIDFYEFVQVLSAALYGSNHRLRSTTMCTECKQKENICFYAKGEICLGLVTIGGCQARCPSLGRPCNGCRGLSPAANLESARQSVAKYGLSVDEFNEKLEMFNQTNTKFTGEEVVAEEAR